MTPRTVVWFSCGVASAVAAYYAVQNRSNVHVVYCDMSQDESPDNPRFLAAVQKWIGHKIEVIRNQKYASVDDVFEQTRYMSGIAGARCTVEMKKVPRFAYQQPDDLHVFGLTADEGDRIEKMTANNPELSMWWVLRDLKLSKRMCMDHIRNAGIELPLLYRQGFRNNNCIGCVKATSFEYWAKVRLDYPDIFQKRAEQSRELGVRLVRWQGERIFLDELPAMAVQPEIIEDISCGPDCAIPEQTFSRSLTP